MREKLRIEIKAEELVAEIARLIPLAGPCNACVHLEKSGDSALFNAGEAVESYSPKQKIASLNLVRREAKEVQKALRALVLKGRLTLDQVARADDLADAIIAMAIKMTKNLETRL